MIVLMAWILFSQLVTLVSLLITLYFNLKK
nr:MAG TPA: hypothetical protein [Caudoviricetes sp.]